MSAFANSILSEIIKPEFQIFYKDWWKGASEKEVRGLQLIGAVYKNKGRKRFKAEPPSVQLKNIANDNILTYEKAEELYHKNNTMTTYGDFFGSKKEAMKPQSNVLKYKKCKELELSAPLTDLAVFFIDNWLELRDDLEFQDLILAAMRSLNSRLLAQKKAISEMKFEI